MGQPTRIGRSLNNRYKISALMGKEEYRLPTRQVSPTLNMSLLSSLSSRLLDRKVIIVLICPDFATE